MRLCAISSMPALGPLVAVLTVCASGVLAQSTPTPSVVIPAKTVVAIRTIDPIDSDGSVADKDYKATVDDPIVVEGVTVAPEGTPAFLRIVQVQQAGAVKGRATVSLRLAALEIQSRRVA